MLQSEFSLIFVLKEMVKWESSEIINAINTKVAGWLSIIEMDLSLKYGETELDQMQRQANVQHE